MTSKVILTKKSQAVRDQYFDIASEGLDLGSCEELLAEETELFKSMERFHKLGHTR